MNEALSETQAQINLAARLLNAEVAEAYGKRTDDAGVRLKELLTIKEGKDTTVVATLKILNFYLCAGRLPGEAPPQELFGLAQRSYDVIVGQVRLKCDKKLVAGKPCGYYRLNIPHFLPDRWEEVRDYHQEFGNLKVIYAFADKRQLKVSVSTEKEGHRAINHLLKAVDPSRLLGTAEDHCYTGRLPKNSKPHRLTGLTLKANRVRTIYPDKTSEAHQI
jgi:hypothetical protein